jgi:hypothetical protein
MRKQRQLLYIPVVHSQADLGGLADSIRKVKLVIIGRQGMAQNIATVGQFWDRLRQNIEQWDLPYPHVRLYQDGLPVCGCEEKIVADLAESGSQNHQLLQLLISRGAVLMGTESGPLLLEEYNVVKQILDAADQTEAEMVDQRPCHLSRALLAQRDEFIAKRINETLLPGETGILFLGMLHSVGGLLAPDILVKYPFDQPSEGKSLTPVRL